MVILSSIIAFWGIRALPEVSAFEAARVLPATAESTARVSDALKLRGFWQSLELP